MNKFYDKILLAIALVLMLSGFGYYLTKGTPKMDRTLKNQQVSGEAFPVAPVKDYIEPSYTWPEPVAQDDEGRELFDIFTPPQIWWDAKDKLFVFIPPIGEIIDPPKFGISLAGIERELYRIQFDSFIRGSDKSRDRVLFHDLEKDAIRRGQIGEEFSESDFKVLSCKTETLKDAQGMMYRLTTAVILDKRTGKEVVLRGDKKHYIEGEYTVELKTSDHYAPQTVVLRKAGEQFTVEDDKFTLKEFDFDKQTATIEKRMPEEDEPEVVVLEVSEPEAAPVEVAPEPMQSSTNEDEDNSDISDAFDLF